MYFMAQTTCSVTRRTDSAGIAARIIFYFLRCEIEQVSGVAAPPCHDFGLSMMLTEPSFDAAVRMNGHAAELVSNSSVSGKIRSQTLSRIAILALFVVVLQGTDLIGPTLGASTLLNTPVIWMLLTVLVAVAACIIQHMVKQRMHRARGEFVLKYDVNVPVRLSALRHWLRKQLPVKVRSSVSEHSVEQLAARYSN